MQGQTLSSGELMEGVVVGDPVFCGKKSIHYLLVTAEASASTLLNLRIVSCVCGLLLGELGLVDC